MPNSLLGYRQTIFNCRESHILTNDTKGAGLFMSQLLLDARCLDFCAVGLSIDL